MKLNNFLKSINYISNKKIKNEEIFSIEYNSKEINKKSLFVAIKGYKNDGHKYIDEAIKNGAKTIIIEKKYNKYIDYSKYDKINIIQVRNTRKILSKISNKFFNEPSKKINVFGITGTNGKTSISFLLERIFKNTNSKVGMIGTIVNKIGNKIIESKNTTPESKDIQNLLEKMLKENCKYSIIEVSSHSLSLNRVDDIFFKSGIFTNLTQDHLDFHKTFENYLKEKKKLLKLISKNGFIVINNDDKNIKKITKKTNIKKITYGINNKSDFMAKKIKTNIFGTSYNLFFMNKIYKVNLKLIGKFNVYNSLASIATAVKYGIDIKKAIKSIKEVIVKGRFQLIEGSKKFAVIVDYAHTPDGLLNVLKTAKKISNKKVICVFGCGGDRDSSKRNIMGFIASKYSDIIILTSDNPRTENSEKIIEMIESGIKKYKNKKYYKIKNRKKAIEKAIFIAENGDIVLILGKGHEEYQIIGTKKYLFSDIEISKKILKGKLKK